MARRKKRRGPGRPRTRKPNTDTNIGRLGSEITRRRLALGISVAEFERRCGVARKVALRWEQGLVFPRDIWKVAEVLGCKAEELFMEKVQGKKSSAQRVSSD